jgi:hypothetical protein
VKRRANEKPFLPAGSNPLARGKKRRENALVVPVAFMACLAGQKSLLRELVRRLEAGPVMAQHRLHLTAFGVGTRRPFAREGGFQPSHLARPGGR